MKILASFVLATWVLAANAESYLGPEVGDLAPTLKIAKWLQAPETLPRGWPTGKVVILEFWSTWCGPCVAAIPHLNALAEQFKSEPVQFIAVTDEKENVVEPFLKRKPFNAWVGLSATSIFGETNPYRVYAIPHTIVINLKGRIAAVMNPQSLDATAIRLCLAGKRVPETSELALQTDQAGVIADDLGACPAVGVVPGQTLIGRTPIYQVMIRPVSTNRPPPRIKSSSSSELGLSMPGGQLKDAITSVFEIERTRLILETELPKDSYDFYISLPPCNLGQHGRTLESVFSQAVEAAFGLNLVRETRITNVFVLRTNSTTVDKLGRSSSGDKQERYTYNEITGVKRSLNSMAEGLENALGNPVFNETDITNLCSFHLSWDQKGFKYPNPEGIRNALKEIGLELNSEMRPLEFIVCRPIQNKGP